MCAYASRCARAFGTAPTRLIPSRFDEARSHQEHTCILPIVGARLVSGPALGSVCSSHESRS